MLVQEFGISMNKHLCAYALGSECNFVMCPNTSSASIMCVNHDLCVIISAMLGLLRGSMVLQAPLPRCNIT